MPSADQVEKVVNEASDSKEEMKAVEAEIAAAVAAEGGEEIQAFPIVVKTLDGAQIQIQVSRMDTIQEVKQYLFEAKTICYVTSYHLEYDGKKVNDFIDLASLNITPEKDVIFQMVEAPYDDRSARLHVRRLRDLLGASSIDLPGSPSVFSHFVPSESDDPFATIESASKEQLELEQQKQQGEQPQKGKKTAAQQKKEKQAAHQTHERVFDPRTFELHKIVNAKLSEFYPNVHETTPPQPIKSITYSGWNAPPSYRKLAGDLFYLEIAANDGRVLNVTAAVNGFFVNASADRAFNPAPSPLYPGLHSHTLVGLLSAVLPSFQKSFEALINIHFEKHPFEVLPVPLPVVPWTDKIKKHNFDLNRAEDSLLLTSDNDVGRGQLRDWNEEFQGCKELPKKTVQDRIFRDRALIKVTYDFVDAATRGAVAIVNKTIPPLNPLDAEKSFMFIYNNIFFSYAMDARDFYKEVGGDRAAHIAANNDLKGVIAYNHADIDGLHTLLTAIVDYRGYRIVAQSIIPGILLREQTSTVHYGSMDHGATIAGNEEFHKLMLQAGKKLHVKEHEVTDEKGTKSTLCSPVECKGIIGTDSRKYVLDLIRTTPRDANWTGRDIDDHTILRPEIIASYLEFLHIQRQRAEVEKKEKEGTTEAEKKEGEEKQVTNGAETEKKEQEIASSVPIPELYFNPDVLVKNSKLTDPEDVQKADTELVTEVSKFLSNIVIPALVEDFTATINCPIDGQTLSSVLHSHGINIRYIGKIATLAAPGIPFFAALCEREMVARAAKYIFNTALRELDTTLPVAPFIAKFLNALLGGLVSNSTTPSSTSSPSTNSPAQNSPTNGTAGSSSSKKNKKRAAKKASGSSTQSSSQKSASSSSSGPAVTPSSLWKSIRESVKEKFQYELKYSGSGRPAAGQVLPLALLRSFVQKVGVQIEAKDYDFVVDQPFNPSNILDLFPIVKHTNPRSSDGVELLQAGRAMLNQLPAAFELVTEALAIFHQVCGPMHVDTAICYSILAQVLVSAGDVAQALLHMKKAVVINERVRGLDHHETIQGYFLLAVFSQQFGHIHAALGFLKRAVYLSTVVCGPQHPETASQHLNLAHVLRDLQQHSLALAYFQEVLEIYESVLGNDSMVSAQLSHEIAIQYSMLDDFKNALLFEKRNYAILKANFGENDPHTQESNIWLKQFTAKAVQMLIEAKKTQRDIIASLSQEKIEEVRNQNLRRGGAAGARLNLGGAGPTGGSAPNAPGDLGSRPLAEILQYIYGGDSGSKRRGGNAGRSADASAGDVGASSARGSRRPPFRGPFFRAGSAGPTTTKAKKTTTGLSGATSTSSTSSSS